MAPQAQGVLSALGLYLLPSPPTASRSQWGGGQACVPELGISEKIRVGTPCLSQGFVRRVWSGRWGSRKPHTQPFLHSPTPKPPHSSGASGLQARNTLGLSGSRPLSRVSSALSALPGGDASKGGPKGSWTLTRGRAREGRGTADLVHMSAETSPITVLVQLVITMGPGRDPRIRSCHGAPSLHHSQTDKVSELEAYKTHLTSMTTK